MLINPQLVQKQKVNSFCVCVCACVDDMLIKLWDWDKKWSCSQVFEGHTHYVMQVVINPKDNNQFASASLDRTIKVRAVPFSSVITVIVVSYYIAGYTLHSYTWVIFNSIKNGITEVTCVSSSSLLKWESKPIAPELFCVSNQM